MVVVGTSGNVYHVTICIRPECSCKDYKAYNRYWSLCKHILFLCVKVSGLSLNNVIQGILSKEDSMLVQSNLNMVEASVSEQALVVYERFESNCCQICSGTRKQNDSKWVCSIYHSGCLSVYHNSCLSEWVRMNPSKRDECPTCKSGWSYDFATTIRNPYLNVLPFIKHVVSTECNDLITHENEKNNEILNESPVDMLQLKEKVKETWKNWKSM